MTSDRKFLWLTWILRILMLFGTLGSLFVVYVRTFVEPDIIDSWASALSALIGGSIFFSTFPWLRIRTRVSKLKKQFSEIPDFNNTLTEWSSKKNDVRHKVILVVTVVITAVFILLNFVLGRIAYLNSRNLELFFHMVVVVATVFIFNSILMIYLVDVQFKEVEELISQYKKCQTSGKKK